MEELMLCVKECEHRRLEFLLVLDELRLAIGDTRPSDGPRPYWETGTVSVDSTTAAVILPTSVTFPLR